MFRAANRHCSLALPIAAITNAVTFGINTASNLDPFPRFDPFHELYEKVETLPGVCGVPGHRKRCPRFPFHMYRFIIGSTDRLHPLSPSREMHKTVA